MVEIKGKPKAAAQPGMPPWQHPGSIDGKLQLAVQ
jgi:hypothetical protein